jgi:glycosyltransferase involved in cell wall biosynthesis
VHRVGKNTDQTTYKPLEDWQISYVPHGINEDVFKPVKKVSDDITNLVHKDKKYDFVLFYNNRNIRRKQPSDIIYAFKLFCDTLSKEDADKCLLLFHTNPVDENGTDLIAVKNALCPEYNVRFTNSKFEQETLNELYNTVDCTINIANNEGFGLTTAESLMAGTPIIVNVTGGLQDQCGFKYEADDYIKIGTLHKTKDATHGDWVVPVWPAAINLNGSVPTPYIFDDRINHEDVVEAIKTVYNWGPKKRKERGKKGREFVKKELSSKVMSDAMIKGIEQTIENFKPRKRYNLYKIK